MLTEPTPLTQFDDSQLDRLEFLLESPEFPDAMGLDEVQGYLCAALSGPRPLSEENWLIDILGDEKSLATPAGQEIAALLRLFSVALETELASGKAPALILYGRDDDEEGASDYAPWCHAYLFAVDNAEEDWFDSLEKSAGENVNDDDINHLDECLFPFMVLTGEAEAAALEQGEDWPVGEEREKMEKDCEQSLPQAVTDIYQFWAARRETRNDTR